MLLAVVLLLSDFVQAAPGDTTIINTNNAMLSWVGAYDSTVVFPPAGRKYRRIYMVFTLGKYACGGTGYCGDWDYTVLNYLITPSGEEFELGRLITPYANAGAPRTPWTWKQHYVYDVTDYASKLHDTAKMRIYFSGYSGGFTGKIDFYFIEGQPDRTVMDVRRLWTGSYSYGDTTHGGTRNINTHFTPLSQFAPEGTESADLKFTVTGHGSDANYCNEFCSHNYKVLLNGITAATHTIWRSDCGSNELFPQSGTWVYERANWCPGSIVNSQHTILPGIIGNTAFNTSVEFDDYVGNGGASYTTEGTLIYYGNMNKSRDLTIEDIVRPTINENYFRENPINGGPVVHIKNTGAEPITAINFQYGVVGGVSQGYDWVGTLNSLQEADVTLPVLPDLYMDTSITSLHTFSVTAATVNGLPDDDNTNNTMTSQFYAAPIWPSTFRINMLTNNERLAHADTVNETSWVIFDSMNNVVTARQNCRLSYLFRDTVVLNPGFYKFQIFDSGCDGLNWWVFSAGGTGITSGYITLEKLNTSHTRIPVSGLVYGGTYGSDFGCGLYQYFTIVAPTEVQDVNHNLPEIKTFPNPANQMLNIDLDNLATGSTGTITVYNAIGSVVYTTARAERKQQVATTSWSNGMYIVEYRDNNNPAITVKTQVIVAH